MEIKISMAGLVFIMGILSLWKENRKVYKKKENKHDKKCRWIFNIAIGTCMVGIVFLTVLGIVIENTQKTIQRSRCEKMLSYVCMQIRGTTFSYEFNKKSFGKEQANYFAGIDFKSNGDMLQRTFDQYKEIIDSTKSKAIFSAVTLLNGYSEYIIHDTNKLNFLTGIIRILDTSESNTMMPLFINKEQ